MSGSRNKKLRKIAKVWAQKQFRDNILVYQTLDFRDRFRIAKAILFKQGDGSPKSKAVKK